MASVTCWTTPCCRWSCLLGIVPCCHTGWSDWGHKIKFRKKDSRGAQHAQICSALDWPVIKWWIVYLLGNSFWILFPRTGLLAHVGQLEGWASPFMLHQWAWWMLHLRRNFWAQWVSLHVEDLKTYYSVDSGFSAFKYDSFYAKWEDSILFQEN